MKHICGCAHILLLRVYRYLLSLDVDKLPTLMKGGSGLEVLGEIVDTLDASRDRCAQDKAGSVFGLVAALSCVDRFPMTVAFLSAAQKQRTSSLLNWLQKHAPTATTTAQPIAAVEEAKEQLSTSQEEQSAVQAQSASGSNLVSTTSSTSTSISSQPRTRLPLQLPASSTSCSYPMLVPGWSSFSSPSTTSASAPSKALAQHSASKASSSAVGRMPRLTFDVCGVKELRKRFKLLD